MKQFLIYAYDATDTSALDRRMSARPAHFEGARKLKAAGEFVIGGALLSPEGKMIGSMMVVQFADESGLERWMKEEPYIIGNVWEKIEVHPFRIADV